MAEKILIIEPDARIGESLASLLRGSGYDVAQETTKEAGVSKLLEWHPSLALVSGELPGGGAFQLLGEKVSYKTDSRTPVIFLSRAGEPEEVNRALSLGVKDYVVVGMSEINAEELRTKVALQLGKNPMMASLEKKTETALGAVSEALKGKTIMWVEDDKFLSDIIGRKLGALECTLIHATNGEEAMQILQKTVPDLILLDILLSGIDGFEILKRVKSAENTKQVPVILLSNLGQKEDVEKGKALGAVRFLIKATVTLDEIVAEIKAVLAGN